MTSDTDKLEIIARFVGGYTDAVGAAMDALSDEQTPKEARRALASVLNYVLDLLDIFPDHYQGMGVADDAMLLRLAAKQAVDAGATQESLRQLAAEVGEVERVVGDLASPLANYVTQLAERTVRGRTVDQILGDELVFTKFSEDVQRQIASHKPNPIDPTLSAEYHVGELRRMMTHALRKAELL